MGQRETVHASHTWPAAAMTLVDDPLVTSSMDLNVVPMKTLRLCQGRGERERERKRE